ncbi:MAG: Inner spore coat protein [Verrucomicrobiota bacterium]
MFCFPFSGAGRLRAWFALAVGLTLGSAALVSAAPPAVSILNPANNALFSQGNALSITLVPGVTNGAASGSVTNVSFFRGSNLIGSASSSPFRVSWNAPAVGTYSLTAVARADDGLGATSAPVSVTISNLPPGGFNLVPAQSAWKYVDANTNLGTAWRAAGYNDSSWSNGVAQLGFGDGDEVTVLRNNQQITTYFRQAFTATNVAAITGLTVRVLRDDGVVVHLNGVEVFRNNMPGGAIAFNTTSSANAAPADETILFFAGSVSPTNLVEGNNVVAVEIHQANSTSSDISFDLELLAQYGTPNVAPLVEITAPANGVVIPAPAAVFVEATASDPDGTINRVRLFTNGVLFGPDTTAPYQWSLSNLVAGAYTLQAVAVDNLGLTATSSVSLTVTGNVPPIATLTAPAGSATNFIAPAAITASATASDFEGAVASVEFYLGAALFAVDSASPFSATTNGVPPGNYAVRAVAIDEGGARGTSAVVQVTVSPNTPPVVALTNPASGASFNAPATVSLQANATDFEGAVASVAFYQNGSLLGTDTTAPFSFAWNSVAAGSYTLVAVATDSLGLAATSAPVSITVISTTPTVSTFIASNSVWRYLDTGTDLGSAWTATGFNDSGWSNGVAQLGYGDGDEATVVSFGPSSTSKYITTYFRRTFAVANASTYTNLTLWLLRDDGGVVYLNGTEVYRSATMPAGAVSFSTLASLGQDNAIDTATISNSGSLLLNGNNVIAVEIHQNTVDSSDLSFDFQLVGIAAPTTGSNLPPTVTLTAPTNNQVFAAPVNITVNANAADADGTVTLVEFLANGAKIGEDASGPFSLAWNNVAPGSYTLRAIATDSAGATATSGPVNVTVSGTGNQPPTVSITSPAAGATFLAPGNVSVTVSASDPDGAVTRVDYYRGGVKVGESSASPFSFTWSNVLVGTFPLQAVAYDAFSASGTSAPVSLTFTGAAPATLIAAGAVWKYFDNGIEPNTAWRGTAFDDASWASGPAELGYGESDEATVVSFGPSSTSKYITTYFRHRFTVANPAAYSSLIFRVLRDDGAVVYLNGIELFRQNMPAGAVSSNTLASAAVSAPDETAYFTNTVPTTGLVSGNNVVAVEVHQNAASSSDLSFNLELIGNTGAVVNNPPVINLTAPSPGAVFTEPATISFQATATDADGPVAKVEFYAGGTRLAEDTSSPYTYTWSGVPLGNYALRAIATDGFGTTSTSAVANVTVVPSTAPTLVSRLPAPGPVGSLTQVTVAFSEPVDGVEAGDLLVNEMPATGLSSTNGTNFTFTFPQPMDGVVTVRFAAAAGIVDRESPPQEFLATATNATWTYSLADNVAPVVASVSPVPGSTLRSLTRVRVEFSEPVTGVGASDLRVNGAGATAVTGSGSGPYEFSVNPPPGAQPLLVTLAWTNTHGIRDLAALPNSFAGGSWSVTLNTNVVETNILITEIMYHPLHNQAGFVPEPYSEEFIELHNRGTTAVNLGGWRLAGGIDYVFPSGSLAPGAYLAVAANLAAFTNKYPGVTNVTGPWTGRLGNTENSIHLENALGQRLQSLRYADSGDWALRRILPDETTARPSLEWTTPADGQGSSLELVNPRLPLDEGQNWSASLVTHGTPGRTNTVLATNTAPLILQVAHSPAVPRSTEAVTITARLLDEQASGLFARLVWRTGGGAFASSNMFDNGLSGDGLAGDGVFGIVLPTQPNLTVVEFYVEALDGGGRVRTWPAATSTNGTQGGNALYQVSDEVYTGGQPIYRLVMTEADNQALADLNNSAPSSNAKYNASLAVTDGQGTRVAYRLAVRHRGAGSRGAQPPNLRLFLTPDSPWSVRAINMNTRQTHSQLAGSVISRLAGLVSEEGVAVQMRRGGTNAATAGSPMFGSHIALESRDALWVENHFPLDAEGNLYTATRPNAGLAPFSPYTPANIEAQGYIKDSNQSDADYTDVPSLIQVMNAPLDGAYAAAVRNRVNVEQFLRYIAVLSLMGYGETSIGSDGAPDDYTLYRGLLDPRFMFFPHDHDTDFGQGDGSRRPATDSVFRAGAANAVINRFLTHPEFVPLYFQELRQQLETVFRPESVTRALDQAYLNFPVAAQTVTDMKTWMTNRYLNVWSQIPTNFTVGAVPALVTSPSLALAGQAPVIETRSVLVNGQVASWNPVTGAWNVNVSLQPGLNRLTVQAVDAAGAVVQALVVETRYDDSSVTTVSGAIAGSTTWSAANGPYQVTGTVTVGDGATLTIQPGTTVLLNNGVGITVTGSGRLLAEGTPDQVIRFTRQLSGGTAWGQIYLNGAATESRLTHAVLEHAGAASGAVRADNSRLYLDSVVFSNTAVQYVNVNNSSFNVRRCVFPSLSGVELFHGVAVPPAGYGIVESNWFGTTTGLNDIIDFTGGQRPNAILQILNNTFTGASDDVLDLDGTDAHIEGNVFVNVRHDPATSPDDTASAISGGSDAGNTSDLTIVRNLFHDVDHVALAKEGNFYTLVNNTMVKVGVAAVNFGEPGRNVAGGAGAFLDGNILLDCPVLFTNYTSAVMTVTVNRSLLPFAFPGTGNTNLNPRLTDVSGVTWQNIRSKFALLPSSPGLEAGPNGLDIGGLVPGGPSLSGVPVSPTGLSNATVVVGGPGITHYRYRLNGGVLSAETPVATPITLSGLPGGLHQLSVLGRNSAGAYADTPTLSRAWIVNSLKTIVRFQELLARNDSAVPVGGRYPDLVELYNPGPSPVSLAGMGVSDDVARPYRYVFPAGATIAAGAHLILYADAEVTPAGFHLGFTLRQEGGALFLTSASGVALDSVVFGAQLANLSIGRGPDGAWRLSQPTFGAANLRAPLGQPQTLRINEWLASGVTPYPDDFVELYNPDAFPVDLGSLFLTDNPNGAPFLHDIAPLSFVAGGGYAVFLADGNPGAGAQHLNFGLAGEQGMIALVAADGSLVDQVIYGPQTSDVAMGRQPNGGVNYGFFNPPSPGGPNPSVVVPGGTVVINEVLALNINKRQLDGSTPDWVEFYNPTTNAVSLGGLSLSDNPLLPSKYVFSNSLVVPPLGWAGIRCDPDQPVSAGNAGFGLKSSGQGLYLFDAPGNGGSLLSAVSFGLQAADFSLGRVPDGGTNWVLCVESIGGANSAVVLGPASALRINEWMAEPSGCNNCDWFEVYNTSPQPVALGGLWLSDDLTSPAARQRHRIAPLSFIGINSASAGAYAYARFEADADLQSGPEHVDFRLGALGEQIGISAADGQLIDGITFGPQAAGVSEGRLPDGGASVTNFPGTSSPGDPNYRLLATVVINEALTHSDPPFEDAIEIRNLSASPIDISGWYLSDKKHDVQKFVVPPGTLLPANGYRVFYETQFNDPLLVKPFSLSSARGDEIYFAAATAGVLTGYRAEVSFGAAQNGVSFGRYVNSVGEAHFVPMAALTFGVDDPDTVPDFRLGTGAANTSPRVGPVVISEILYHPTDLEGGLDDPLNEYIELRNITAVTQPLYDPAFPTNRWRLRDAVDFTFPPGVSLPPGEVLLVVPFDPADPAALAAFRARYGVSPTAVVHGPWSGQLANGSESVELVRPDAPQAAPDPDAGYVPSILVDKVKYSDAAPWPSADGNGLSLQRLAVDEYGNDPVNWTAAAPTPGPAGGGGGDTDGDGMPDAWEALYPGLNPLANDAAGDLDGDGMTNLQEYLAGTAPNDAASALRVSFASTSPMVLQFGAAAGKAYVVEFRNSLGAGSWTTLATVAAGPAGPVQVTDVAPPASGRFYRVRLQ